MKNTIQDSVLAALKNGSQLTSAQISSKFKDGNPKAVIKSLRFAGYPVYLNTTKTGAKKYRLGSASRAVVAAGYKAMAKNLV